MKRSFTRAAATIVPGLLFCSLFTVDARENPPAGDTPPTGGKLIDIQALNAKYRNAVVRIESTSMRNMEETKLNPRKSESYVGDDDGGAHGSGFFVNDSEIVTNAHVVEDARKGSIRVKTPASGNVTFAVDVEGVGGSGSVDIAIIKLPQDERMRYCKLTGLKSIPYLSLGNSNALKQSDPLAIFGYPTSSDELKVIQAEVTGWQYQHDGVQEFYTNHQYIEVGPGGVVQPGNSGGPALDSKGLVVGVPTIGNWYGNQGWLIPVAIIRDFMGRIRNNQAGKIGLQIPSLGIVLSKNSTGTLVLSGAPEEVALFELGVVVREVFPKSMGEAWGLKTGDILVGFANKQRNLCCALDFEGYRVVAGKMSRWPSSNGGVLNSNLSKIHLNEMIFSSVIGDEITLWYIRPSQGSVPKDSLRVMTNTIANDMISPLPHIGLYQKPDYEYWGDFIVQDFNEFNVRLYRVPVPEVVAGGVLVTYVEPNSLASHAGLEMSNRFTSGRYRGGRSAARGASRWFIIEKVNGTPVSDLAGFRSALRNAEKAFVALLASAGYRPERKPLYPQRYTQLGIRTNTDEGKILHFDATFPVDEAMEFGETKN